MNNSLSLPFVGRPHQVVSGLGRLLLLALMLVTMSLPGIWRAALAAPFGWGGNGSGQIGDGTLVDKNLPVDISTSGALNGKTVTQVVAASSFSLALCSDGTVASWGTNNVGQLGDGTTTNSSVPLNITASGALAGKTVVRLTAGTNHSLALFSDGTLAVWGTNGNGQYGNGTITASLVPVVVPMAGALAGKTVTQVSAGSFYTLALCSDGTVASWGSAANGKSATTTQNTTPFDITAAGALNGKTVTQLIAGPNHAFARFSDGTIAAWGQNTVGQLGLGTTNTVANPTPTLVTGGALAGKSVTQLSASTSHTLAVCSDNTVVAWGANTQGKLGDGTTVDKTVAVDITASGVLSGKTVKQLAGGFNNSVALLSDGTIAAWGLNSVGQFGNGTLTSSTTPVFTSTGSNIGTQVSAGPGDGRILALLTVAPNLPPRLNNSTFTTAINVAFSQQLNGIDPEAQPLTYGLAGGALPAGITLSAQGLLSGTPTVAGRSDFSVNLSDGVNTVTSQFIIVVSASAGDAVAPNFTQNANYAPLTRNDLASRTISGNITDVAQAGITPSGVSRTLFQLRRNSDGFSYSGPNDGFTANTMRGYYPGTQGARTPNTTAGTQAYSRSLSFIPATLTPGSYTLVVVGQDVAGNYSVETVIITILAPPAVQAPAPIISSGRLS